MDKRSYSEISQLLGVSRYFISKTVEYAGSMARNEGKLQWLRKNGQIEFELLGGKLRGVYILRPCGSYYLLEKGLISAHYFSLDRAIFPIDRINRLLGAFQIKRISD